jgi:uncharacterized protein YdeI (YjbR/CyaY-like superfamily)
VNEILVEGKTATYVEWIEEAKRPDTRARRIDQTIERLTEGRTPS